MQNENILFGTPIWIFDNLNISNEKLEQEGIPYKNGNYFDLNTPEINKLKYTVKDYCDQIAEKYRWDKKATYIIGRQNPIRPGENDTPHGHHHAMMVAVYYLQVPEKSGDIILNDPRGMVFWVDPQVVNDGSHKSCRSYHRITPKPGMLLMFPNYLIHSVETNLSNQMRLSIMMEIYNL